MHRPIAAALPWCLAALLAAQQQQPPPRAAEHAILEQLAGTWEVTTTWSPGGDPTMSQGTATDELVAGGLWLKSHHVTEVAGQPAETYALTGFDPKARRFTMLWVDGSGAPASRAQGTWDAATHTLTLERELKQADGTTVPGRTTVTIESADRRRHRTSAIAADGKETLTMESVFVRAEAVPQPADSAGNAGSAGSAANAAPAANPAVPPKPPTPHHELLYRLAGDWDCAVASTMPGMSRPSEARGTQTRQLVCGGRWLLGRLQLADAGESYALLGFDDKLQRYVQYSVDSTNPVLSTSSSVLDLAGKELRGTGTVELADATLTSEGAVRFEDDGVHLRVRYKTEGGREVGTLEAVETRRPPPPAK